jgi:hypothetical protein
VTDHPTYVEAKARLDALADEIYSALAAQFPVCLSSDEFHFFPQFRITGGKTSPWDDFSDDAVQSFLTRSVQWRRELGNLRLRPGASHISDASHMAVSIALLSRVLTTLEEQLGRVCPHKTQPTFYLTIISIGLAEAMDEDREAFGRRIRHLPRFLETATAGLEAVPAVFRDLALDMIPKVLSWMALLPITDGERRGAMGALDAFAANLAQLDGLSDFRLPKDLYARVAEFHMGCQMGLDEIAAHLDNEIEAASRDLAAAAVRIEPGKPWLAVFHALPCPQTDGDDAAALFKGGIARLKSHCLQYGLFDRQDLAGSEVEIRTIPAHMAPVRANAAYSMPPGHPPRGGVFYLRPLAGQPPPRDMMLLAAHETYPGHHLLDTIRWKLAQPLRRCLEFPLFYEGWASLSEEILFDTGFFSGPADRLMMAKRRFWRAMRGRADFRIHTGRWRLSEAASALADVGLVSPEQALAMVRRYALKPGYQLSYAIGRRRFRQLYKAYQGRGKTPAQFVRAALSRGEVGFDHLADGMLHTN